MSLPFEGWDLIGFEPAPFPKKYYAVLRSRAAASRLKRMPFGDQRYQQYRDQTPLGLFTHLNHGDVVRRRNYRARHAGDRLGEWSPGYLSWTYLW
jgi:hypothetical protein